MSYHYVRPEEAGICGEKSAVSRTSGRPVVTCLDFELDSPPQGGSVYCPWGVVCVTAPLLELLNSAKVTGFEARSIAVTGSEALRCITPELEQQLPALFWLEIIGTPFDDDIGLEGADDIVVSERALKCFQRLDGEKLQVKPADEGPIRP